MADASWPHGSNPGDGWGPATSVRGSGGGGGGGSARGSANDAPQWVGQRTSHQAPPLPPRGQRTTVAPPLDHDAAWAAEFRPGSVAGESAWERLGAVGPARTERGLRAVLALLVVVGITVAGLLVDAARGVQLGTGFNIGIIAGSVLAILLVRRSGMFPVVVAPPIVYSLGAGVSLYLRSSGLHDRGVLIDAATNWLVYGFPAIAAASAAVLIIAGIRLITRR